MVNVVFDNPLLYVIDYPGQDAVEIFDKRSGRLGLVRGAVAERFRHDFGILLAKEPDEEGFGDFIDDYASVMNQTAVLH